MSIQTKSNNKNILFHFLLLCRFVLGAVSPAVVVPQLLVLQEKGYGVQQGIPTLVMAASSCDDVLAISLFGVFLGIAFSEGTQKSRVLETW
jgi:NhaP-type Na+/H+ or K+/H+ antiporter